MQGFPPALGDISNQNVDNNCLADKLRTFSRRPKQTKDPTSSGEETTDQKVLDNDQYAVPVGTPPCPAADRWSKKGKQRKAAEKSRGYNRKAITTASEQEEVKRKAYMAAMRAHFEEVDAFELQVESEDERLPLRPAPQDKSLPALKQKSRKQYQSLVAAGEAEDSDVITTELPLSFGAEGPVSPPSTRTPSRLAAVEGSAHPLAALEENEFSPFPDVSRHAEVQDLVVTPAPKSKRGGITSNLKPGMLRTPQQQHEEAKPTAFTTALSRRTSLVPQSSAKATGSARKAPAYGLSRRSSVCFTDSKAVPKDYLGASWHTADGASPAAVRSARFSNAADAPSSSLFSRLSMRLSDALQRLRITGAVPQCQEEGPLQREELEEPLTASRQQQAKSTVHQPGYSSQSSRRISSVLAGDCSPIAESPEMPQEASTLLGPHVVPATPFTGSKAPAVECCRDDNEENSSPKVASIAAALRDRLQLDGSPACRIQQQALGRSAVEELGPLQQLLQVCNQSTDEGSIPSMEALLGQHVDLAQVRKIGEGTFGEAFKGGNVVFKIVPLEGATPVNGEPQKRAGEILGEVAIALTLSQLRGSPGSSSGNVTSGFVETYGVGICRGRYAPSLLAEWHAWDEQNGSENDPVDCFPGDQLYVVFVVADGGADLERFEVRNFTEAKSVLLQCAMILAVAEEACEFEHRDLHWGNILVRRQPHRMAAFKLRGVDVSVNTDGLTVTLIDFTLSRLRTLTDTVAFCDLEADPELFSGPKRDCQAETYRRMRKATKGNWQKHMPATNTLWMHYLADLLLSQKQVPLTAQQKKELRGFRKRAASYKCCADLIVDDLFNGTWQTGRLEEITTFQ